MWRQSSINIPEKAVNSKGSLTWSLHHITNQVWSTRLTSGCSKHAIILLAWVSTALNYWWLLSTLNETARVHTCATNTFTTSIFCSTVVGWIISQSIKPEFEGSSLPPKNGLMNCITSYTWHWWPHRELTDMVSKRRVGLVSLVTAFWWGPKLFCYKRMLLGLKNATAAFQQIVDYSTI